MKTLRVILIISFVLFGAVFINCTEKEENLPQKTQFSKSEKNQLSSGNKFAFEFFRHLSDFSDQNTLVSPLSVSMALSMTSNGACNVTRDKIKESLFLSNYSEEEVNKNYKSIIETLENVDRDVIMKIANSVWYRNTFPVEEEFISTNKNYYDARVEGLDFNSSSSKETINAWVKEATDQKIEKIVDQVNIEDVMFLINALYFKGNWAIEFDPAKTHEDTFYRADGNKLVKMMEQTSSLDYYNDTKLEIVDLPYGSDKFSMMVFLPKENYSVNTVIEEINAEKWEEWNSGLVRKRINLKLPKFKFESELKLNSILSDMGMGIAFDQYEADFCKINPNEELYISRVKHKTYIDLNEKGTEAAAVTSVAISLTSVQREEAYPFYVNKPFVFVIREKSTNSILFMGKVEKPE